MVSPTIQKKKTETTKRKIQKEERHRDETSKHGKVKVTLMQIWKSTDIFLFTYNMPKVSHYNSIYV